MEGKPVIVFNRRSGHGGNFWDPLIDLLSDMCQPGDFLVAREMDDLIPAIVSGIQERGGRAFRNAPAGEMAA
jgi:hypothetical protein